MYWGDFIGFHIVSNFLEFLIEIVSMLERLISLCSGGGDRGCSAVAVALVMATEVIVIRAAEYFFGPSDISFGAR